MSQTINLNLDITKSEIQNPRVSLRQGDGNLETLHVTLTANGDPVNLTGNTVTFMGTTAGQHKIVDTNVNVIDNPGGVFEYTFPKQWGMDMGDFKNAYFKISQGDKTGSTASFKVKVLSAVDLNAENAKDYISVADGVIDQIKTDGASRLSQLNDNIDKSNKLNKQATDLITATNNSLTGAKATVDKATNDGVSKINTVTSTGLNQLEEIIRSGSATNPILTATSDMKISDAFSHWDWTPMKQDQSIWIEFKNAKLVTTKWGNMTNVMVNASLSNDSLVLNIYPLSNPATFGHRIISAAYPTYDDNSINYIDISNGNLDEVKQSIQNVQNNVTGQGKLLSMMIDSKTGAYDNRILQNKAGIDAINLDLPAIKRGSLTVAKKVNVYGDSGKSNKIGEIALVRQGMFVAISGAIPTNSTYNRVYFDDITGFNAAQDTALEFYDDSSSGFSAYKEAGTNVLVSAYGFRSGKSNRLGGMWVTVDAMPT
ncbi:BppU family phage baseplate upper protein [Eupransor demetentiae]|uniref:BppU N-terminal domain-containing protein n=1 Tax=Eupransor demetentiae TaxID=3109584 RepID=A0ABM9N4L4_9LACO|nr:hypothetical protein R54876_GBNLAHCA_00671 [Lactobacillaceae bacterium LMG 33000]